MGSERYSRNEALFGAEGQMKIAATRVGIVGLGGLGSHVAQQLAYLGVRRYALIDFDIVTDSSLNRLIGAFDSDVGVKTRKIEVAERTIKAVIPTAEVATCDRRIKTEDAEAEIAASDVVFGCLDRDLPRLQLAELCSRYAKPFFDLATDTGTDEVVPWYGGRVLFSNGDGCLVCHDLLDQDEIRLDSTSPEQRAEHDRIYGVKQGELAGTGPMVVSINGLVASLAVTELMVFVTGLRAPAQHLVYRGEKPTVGRDKTPPEPDCYFCKVLWGSSI